MTHIRLVEPPGPPDGQEWCPICLMRAKHAQISRCAAEIDRLTRDGMDKLTKWIPWPDDAELRPARYRGASALMPQLGPLLLCWECIGFIDAGDQRPPSILDTGNGGRPLPRGLRRG
jgi:hypothetical protein